MSTTHLFDGPTVTTGSPSIVARGLTKRFGEVNAVEDLSFEVRPGKVTGFLGSNGAGKSTTLRMLLGLVCPTTGGSTVLGMPYRNLDRPSLRVGAVLDTQSFHPIRSGRNHLRVMAVAAGIAPSRVDEVLAKVGLMGAANRKVGGYSLGMRQRLALAGALLGNPRVLILDEPANGLDPQGIKWLRELLRGIASRGSAVLVSSHLLAEMAEMADDIIVIHRGRLIRQGTIDQLTIGTSALRVASREAERLERILELDGMTIRRISDGLLLVRGGTSERVGELATSARITLIELAIERNSLEDVFLELTTGHEDAP